MLSEKADGKTAKAGLFCNGSGSRSSESSVLSHPLNKGRNPVRLCWRCGASLRPSNSNKLPRHFEYLTT